MHCIFKHMQKNIQNIQKLKNWEILGGRRDAKWKWDKHHCNEKHEWKNKMFLALKKTDCLLQNPKVDKSVMGSGLEIWMIWLPLFSQDWGWILCQCHPGLSQDDCIRWELTLSGIGHQQWFKGRHGMQKWMLKLNCIWSVELDTLDRSTMVHLSAQGNTSS